MNRIKLFLIFIMSISFFQEVFAQCLPDDCDPLVSSFVFAEACTNQGSTTTLFVNWSMSSGSGSCNAPAESWQIYIQLPTSGEYGVVDATSVLGPEFTWTYDAGNKVLRGASNTSLGINVLPNPAPHYIDEGVIQVTINATNSNTCTAVLSNANIVITTPLHPEQSCTQAFGNQTANDSQSATLGVDAAALPVNLLGFKVQSQTCNTVELEWSTSAESNNEGFEIQRSADKINFEVVDFVFAEKEETGDGNYYYSYVDRLDRNGKPLSDIYYYRLKQVDYDGQFELFDVYSVRTNCKDKLDIELYPVPSSTTLTYKLSEEYLGRDLNVNVFSSDGRLILNRQFKTVSELKNHINTTDLPDGVYRISFVSGVDKKEYKFIKIR